MRCFLLLFPGLLLLPAPLAAADTVDYLHDIKPILKERCYACHAAVKQKGQLRLDTAAFVRKGGRHGPAIVPGKLADSHLVQRVCDPEDSVRMPPEGKPLTDRQIALLKAWIEQGAAAPADEKPEADPRKHWAFVEPLRLTIPAAAPSGNPIDAFLAAMHGRHGLKPNPPADKAMLLRRVTLDLIGLPPSREELHTFLADTSPDAYEKVVDRLLASPQYGERWGRHWMDVWRYSDPFGLGEEYRYSQRHIWRWRDWIIESLNADKGYDRMIVEMLAGDEVAPADPDTLRATGYLARNWYKFNRNVWIQDTVEYTAAGFLGITLRCARCHDHKYDPIAQQDYYRFRAFFEPHDLRIDPVPGQPDIMKDGIARAFDAKPDAPTYLFQRGDERMADTSQALAPTVPAVLGGAELVLRPVQFSPHDFAAALEPAIAAATRQAQANLNAAEAAMKQSAETVAAARRRLEQVATGDKPKDEGPEPWLHDTFAVRSDSWQVIRGDWVWDKGWLVCKTTSSFATVTTKTNHPAALMGRIRYRTTGGGIGSVGFSYDVAGNDFQAVYLNAGNTSAVRAFHRLKGQDTYPTEGVVPFPVKFQDEVTLDFAVRGNLLNTWVNGKLCNVYRLPVPRQAGAFGLWTHDATAEFIELRLAALPDSVPLGEKPGEDRPSPVGGPGTLTKADAERLLQQAEETARFAEQKQQAARSVLAAIEARAAAERVRFAESKDQARWQSLAVAASKAEKQANVLKTADALRLAEQGVTTKATPDSQAKLTSAKKAHDDAVAVAVLEDANFTPLVKIDPAGSSGRRLALAKWITDRRNPLTARVAVNHIWMRHFGRPLVGTIANFGLNGQRPTHPELLDWLAVEFMEGGWTMKPLHRLMVTSDAYRRSSHDGDAATQAADPENRYLWRMNPRRMEAEVVRDSLLAAAGQLDAQMGGPILDPKLGQTVLRRSVYFRFNTEYRIQFLDQFDAASPTECYQRHESVIPQQGLALTNSALALNQSRLLARKLAEQWPESAAFVTKAFEQVLGRSPSAEERDRCERFLREQSELLKQPEKLTPFPPATDAVIAPAADPAQRAREDLIQVLFNHNDFVTVR
jgi:hypothetical protein